MKNKKVCTNAVNPLFYNGMNVLIPCEFDFEEYDYYSKVAIHKLKPEEIPKTDEDGYNYLCGYDLNHGKEGTQPALHCIAVSEI